MSTKVVFSWLFIASMFFIACQGEEKQASSADSLKDCLSDKEVAFISHICDRFEAMLVKAYPVSTDNLDDAYKSFVNDYLANTIKVHQPEDLENLSKLAGNPLFNMIWKKEDGIWATDRSGKYFSCIYSKAPKSKILEKVFSELSNNPSLSPILALRSLMPRLTIEDLQSNEIRTMFALHIYAEQGINLHNLTKK